MRHADDRKNLWRDGYGLGASVRTIGTTFARRIESNLWSDLVEISAKVALADDAASGGRGAVLSGAAAGLGGGHLMIRSRRCVLRAKLCDDDCGGGTLAGR